MGGAPDRGRQGVRRRPLGRRDPRAPRHAHRAGPQQPLARAAGRGEPRPLRAHAQGRVPRRRPRAAGEDRHGLRQHQPARPGAVPDPARVAPAHGRRLVRLPHLRLRPRPVGRDRGHHALDLHARVRGPPAALRLVPREPAGAVAPAPVRVRAAQAGLHGAVEALPAEAGRGRPRARLGRPAHAHHLGPPTARLPGPGDPRLRRADRRRQARRCRRLRDARALRARRAQQAGAAALRGAAAAEAHDRRTTRKARSKSWTPTTTPRTKAPGRARCRSRARS